MFMYYLIMCHYVLNRNFYSVYIKDAILFVVMEPKVGGLEILLSIEVLN